MTRTPEEIERWIDHLEICDVLARFAEGLDSRNPVLYRSIMTDEVEIDYSSWRPDEPLRMVEADAWVARGMHRMSGLDATQHTITNIQTFIDGDTAVVTAYIVAEHFMLNSEGDSHFTLNGYYRDKLVRTEQGWKLSGISLNVKHQAGNKNIMTMAWARSDARVAAEKAAAAG